MVYALLCKTNIGHLLSSKTKDIFSKEDSDHFTKHLEEEVKKLEYKKDQQLQVELFLEITKLLKLRGTKYSLEKEIEDQCTNIVNEVYAQLQKQDKKFRSYTENQLNSTKLQQMVQFQMSKVFTEIDDSFQDFSIQDQEKFAAQVNEYIHSLPEDKQTKIKEKLGINDLTDEMLRKAIATSGTSIVFAIIVEVSGFAFYTTATSLVASFAGLFGLTLPFGFYTGLTSTIAVLANPLFIIPLLLGGGALLVNHQNKSLRKKLLPIIVMQVALPFMSKESEDIKFDSFIQEWEKRYERNQNLHKQLGEIVAEQKELQDQIYEADKLINNYKVQINQNEHLITNEKETIKSALKFTKLDQISIGESFRIHARDYQRISQDIKELNQSKKVATSKTGFFERIGNSISNISSTIDIRNKERELVTLLENLVEDVLYSNSTFKQNERENVSMYKDTIKQLKTSKKMEENKKRGLEETLRNKKLDNQSINKQIKIHEKENYGLNDLFI